MDLLAIDLTKGKAYMQFDECWYCMPCEKDCPNGGSQGGDSLPAALALPGSLNSWASICHWFAPLSHEMGEGLGERVGARKERDAAKLPIPIANGIGQVWHIALANARPLPRPSPASGRGEQTGSKINQLW